MDTGIAAIALLGAEPGSLAMRADGSPALAGASIGSNDFVKAMARQLESVNADMAGAETALRDLSAGRPVELHDTMIQLERAHLSVQTFVQIRNRMTEAYQDVLRMQM